MGSGYIDGDGCEYGSDRSTLVVAPITLKRYVMPWHATYVSGGAFRGCDVLESADISKADIIPWGTFRGCSALKSVNFSPMLRGIGDQAFRGCKSLATLVIPPGPERIGAEAFADCSALHSIVIPPSVKEIGSDAFAGCKALRRCEIPDGVTLGDGAFPPWCVLDSPGARLARARQVAGERAGCEVDAVGMHAPAAVDAGVPSGRAMTF